MIELKPLTCQNCGAQIDRRTMKCPYCDTQYERKHDGGIVQFVVERPGVHRIRAEVRIADEVTHHYPEQATKMAMDKMRHQIADGLLDYLTICTEHNPMGMYQIIRGEVRVVDPTFSDY